MKDPRNHKAAMATNSNCFAYERGSCSATKAAECNGCPFFKSRKDAKNNELMQVYDIRRHLLKSETSTIRVRT